MPTYRGKDSVITTITLPRGLHRQAKALAKKRYIKLSPLIRSLLSDWLNENKGNDAPPVQPTPGQFMHQLRK